MLLTSVEEFLVDIKRCEDVRLWLFKVEFLVELLKQSRLNIAEECLLGESEETHGSEWAFIYTKLCYVMLMSEYPRVMRVWTKHLLKFLF